MSDQLRIDQFFLMHDARTDQWRNVLTARSDGSRASDGQGRRGRIGRSAGHRGVSRLSGPARHAGASRSHRRERCREGHAASSAASPMRSSPTAWPRTSTRTRPAGTTAARCPAQRVRRPQEAPALFRGPVRQQPASRALSGDRRRDPAPAASGGRVHLRAGDRAQHRGCVLRRRRQSRIAAVVINEGTPLRSRHQAPVLRAFLDPLVGTLPGSTSGLKLADILQRIRAGTRPLSPLRPGRRKPGRRRGRIGRAPRLLRGRGAARAASRRSSKACRTATRRRSSTI